MMSMRATRRHGAGPGAGSGRILTAVALVSLIMMVGGSAVAQGFGPRERAGRGTAARAERRGEPRFLDRLAERLDLTEQQQEQLAKIRDDGRARDAQLRKQMLRVRNELHGEWLKDDPAEKKLLALTKELGELRTQQRENRVRDRLAMRDLLTDEQRDQLLLMGPRGGRGGEPGSDRPHFRRGARGRRVADID